MVIYYQDKPERGQLPNILTEANTKLCDVRIAAAGIHKRTYYWWVQREQKAEAEGEVANKLHKTTHLKPS